MQLGLTLTTVGLEISSGAESLVHVCGRERECWESRVILFLPPELLLFVI